MPFALRILCSCAVAGVMFTQTACNMVPFAELRRSQLHARQLHQQAMVASQEQDRLASENQSLQGNLQTANERLDNLNAERSTLQERYVSLLKRAQDQPSPLSKESTRRLEEFARKYGIEFDPQTGVSKFHSDVLFDSGSADIKKNAHSLLQEFAQILNDGEAKRLNILVVGHTDDKPIVKNKTKVQHQTNWHLSTDRADSVVVALAKSGIKDNRMGVAGYSMHQPLVPNSDDKARQRNRRVEIYVLAPDAVVAGWDPGSFKR